MQKHPPSAIAQDSVRKGSVVWFKQRWMSWWGATGVLVSRSPRQKKVALCSSLSF